MSFGGGGFGGFGQQNTQASSGFGGFGGGTTTSTGFGSGTTGTFGQSNPSGGGGGLFGSGTQTTGTFGSGTGGFGSTTAGGFGSKPAFGSTTAPTGGSLFGSSSTTANPSTSGFGGGFGSTTASTSSPFGGGGGTTSGGLFGSSAPKSTFGSTAAGTGSSLFGGTGSNTASGGFGATGNDPPGTAVTPFTPFTEKEGTSNQSNSFQNILFQDPYKKFSAEELRLVDYAQGRRHGNASGAGAFGVSSGFGGGGFGATTQGTGGFGQTAGTTTGGGLFGSSGTNTTTGTGFGQTGTTGFGGTASSGGGLFGSASKPSGGLFGSTPQQQQQQQGQQGGGLFGSSTGGGFGSSTSGTGFGQTNNTQGGLFGSSSQAQKPQGTGFSFGNTGTTGSTFGSTQNTGFGSGTTTTGTGLFGNNNTQQQQQQQQSTGGLFGQNTQQQQQPQQQTTGGGFGGGLFGQQGQNQQSGGLFGSTQAKPTTGGLFGSSTANTGTGGGLFGGANTQQQNTGGFGTTSTTTGGGLFGAKPSTGTGLFGGGTTTQTANSGGGLFGNLSSNNQAQQPSGGGLFGSTNNAQQQKPSLFGNSTTQSSGTGLFGAQNNQAQGSSLFGASNQQQQQNQSLGNSLLGNSQQSNAPQGLTANLNDVSAYGTPSLFAGSNGAEVANPGPLATPLNGNSKPRRSSILPMYKLAPASASRYATPQKRGFGFSYSTYGTPAASPASSISSTPGNLGRSLLGSSVGGSLSKSMSTNNLRRSFNTEDSILAPGAFSSSSGPRWYGSTGSKKLVINRDIRSDLFSTPQKDKQAIEYNTGSRKLSKRVSFDTSNVDNEDGTPVRAALPAPEVTPKANTEETPRQNRNSTGTNSSMTPEVDQVQVQGKELAIVHEEDSTSAIDANSFDNAPGPYWLRPSMEELQNMNRVQRTKVDGFTVGRDNVGFITFKVPVDLSSIDLEELCGGVIQLEPRSATVYPVAAKKPPVGKGLNVPARIALEQSWPRGGRDKRITSDPKRFNKHVERLKRITDTEFESYDKETGIWTFSVEHFTTYGLDESDEDSDEDLIGDESPAPGRSQQPMTDVSLSPLGEDDAFDFRRRRGLPGAFGEQDEMFDSEMPSQPSFLGVSSADSAPNDVRLSLEDQPIVSMDDEYGLSEDEDITRTSIRQHQAAEQDDSSSENGQDAKKSTPGGILRARMRAMKDSVGPVKLEVADGDDWMEMLRKTVSPTKRDRQGLRNLANSPSVQSRALTDVDKENQPGLGKSQWQKSTARRNVTQGQAANIQTEDARRGFATSIDLMNSLFEKPNPASQSLRASKPSKGFPKWPYDRQDKTRTMDAAEKAFHDAGRPTWGPNETLVVTRSLDHVRPRETLEDSSTILSFQRLGIRTNKQDVRLAAFATEPSKKFLRSQDRLTKIHIVDGVPMASLHAPAVKDVFHHQHMSDPGCIHEKRVWGLASILFDDIDIPSEAGEHVQRKAVLSRFWTDLVEQASSTTINLAGSSEEKAVACLGGHRVTEACKHLLDGKNFRLGTLVSLIGTSDTIKKEMREQVKAWQDSKMLSEFSEAIRTIYELLSGNVGVCEGMKGVPAEDRLDSFVISKKFGLDWKQSFGLRLWYAIGQDDDLGSAVSKYQNDITQDREDVPRPWYAEQGIQPLWNDPHAESREDLLWGLLRLYADPNADLESILRPENSQLSPLDMRLGWQLGLALTTSGKVTYGRDGGSKADAITVSYASQLTSAGEWLEAIFVLLHLSEATSRRKAIQEHLCRHAGQIGSESGSTFSILTEKFQIPASWIWEALALYMRSVKKDPSAEVHCLLRAGSFVEAHRVLLHQVGPSAIVERGYGELSSLIGQFEGRQDSVPDWSSGGEIYNLFLQLLHHRAKGESVPLATLDALMGGLHAMNEDAPPTDILRYAAVSDMADETAREILKLTRKKQDTELRSKILNLPLTQDRLLAYSVDMSMERYREVMSH